VVVAGGEEAVGQADVVVGRVERKCPGVQRVVLFDGRE
jgi:hypothetical protein